MAVKRRSRPDSKQHLYLRRRQLAGPADGVQWEIHHLRRHRQPPERRNVDLRLAAWPPAGVHEQERQQHRLRLQCRRQAHFQDGQRHNVQRQQVFLPEKCSRRCHRSCERQRHPGGVLHLRSLGRAHVHRRHYGRHAGCCESPALPRVRL